MFPRAHVVLAVSLGGLLSLQVVAEDWPQWRGPARDGSWKESGTLEAFPADGLKAAWRAPIGRGWSSPVVVGGQVYVTDVQAVKPTATERVLCFDAVDGRRLWNHEYVASYPEWAFDPNAGGPRSTPIIRDGRLFTLGAGGDLFCLIARQDR